MPAICDFKRLRIIELTNEHTSQREIARVLSLSLSGVQKVIEKHKKGFGIANRPKSGRPRKMTARTVRKLTIASKQNPLKTASQLRRDVGLTDVVSNSTVKRTLRENGLFGRVAVRKPCLTQKQRRKRKEWCLERSQWNFNDWAKIIFSDESKVELMPKRRVYVRRSRTANKFDSKYVLPTKKFCSSLMVWGAIRADGKRVLLRCSENVNQQYYQVLLGNALPRIYNTRYVFQQDGATCHTAKSTSQYLVSKNIRCLPWWPAQSPDLSPIENLWDIVKERTANRSPVNIDQLWQFFCEEWEKIPNSTISKLFHSMPSRIRAVISANGGNSKY